MLRSMTPAFNTIINFSLNVLLQKTHKLRYLSNSEASNEIEFPRAKRRLLQLNSESEQTFNVSSFVELTDAILRSKAEAVEIARSCKMDISSYNDEYLSEGRLKLVHTAAEDDGEEGGDARKILQSLQKRFCAAGRKLRRRSK